MSTDNPRVSRTIVADGDRPAAPTNGGADRLTPATESAAGTAQARSRSGLFFAVVFASIVGLAAGVVFHGPLVSLFGMHDHSAHSTTQPAGTKQLWTCSMHPQVIKEEPGLCPICHMALTPVKGTGGSAPSAQSAASAERKVKYWWDPMMNPPYITDKPGKSPMGMDLIAVYDDQLTGGTAVTIDPVVVQNMGIRIATVTTGPVRREVRAVGYLDEAQPNVRDVNLRVSGWVEKLQADTVGMALSKGTPLFDLYSPEVQVATEELIAARKSIGASGATPDPIGGKTAQTLFDATRLKLEQWGLDPKQVEELAKLDRPPRTVTFTSPIDGYLTQKMIVQGGAVKAGDTMLKIVDLSTVWLDSQVYAQDLPFIRLGGTVTAMVEGVPGKRFEGQVVFVQPELDPQTRTAIVRIALSNMELNLRPGMYATASILATLADRAVLVPREAVIDTGTRQLAFVVAGEGRFEPRMVRLGAGAEGGMAQVLEGLAPGETIVTSGQFLLDAESRMREAIQKHLDRSLLANAGSQPKAPVTPATAPAVAVAPGVEATTQPAAAHVHDGRVMPPATAPSPEIDRLFEAYLAIQKTLGAPQQADTPLELAALKTAARAAAESNTISKDAAAQARRVLDAVAAMEGKSLTEQRKLYKPLSDAVIALAKTNPPSASVAAKLYVAFCPMAPGDGARWLQTTTAIANPYFATKMKECGSIEQTLEGRKAE